MGAFQRWLDKQDVSCCPDPDPDYIDALDMAEPFDNSGGIYDAIEAHGFESRSTPVDILMAGPVSMGLQHAHDMEFGDYA